jgi:hypothetical protein
MPRYEPVSVVHQMMPPPSEGAAQDTFDQTGTWPHRGMEAGSRNRYLVTVAAGAKPLSGAPEDVRRPETRWLLRMVPPAVGRADLLGGEAGFTPRRRSSMFINAVWVP